MGQLDQVCHRHRTYCTNWYKLLTCVSPVTMSGVYLLMMCSVFHVPVVLGTDISNKLDQVSAQLHNMSAQLTGTATKLNTKMDQVQIQLKTFEAHLTAAEAKLVDIVQKLDALGTATNTTQQDSCPKPWT